MNGDLRDAETYTPAAVGVLVIIVSYRCAEAIAGCLASLMDSDHSSFIVHVCENGGRDAFMQLREAVGRGRIETEEAAAGAGGRLVESCAFSDLGTGRRIVLHRADANLGYAGAINAVLDRTRSDRGWQAVWIINPDVTVAPDAMRLLTEEANSSASDLVACRVAVAASSSIQMYGGRWRRSMARGLSLGRGDPIDAEVDGRLLAGAIDFVSGAALYATRRYVESVGPMSEDYFLYCEEVDWCLRRGSMQVGFASAARVYHEHGVTMGSSSEKRRRSALSVYLDERNKLLLTRRHFPTRFPLVVVTTALLLAQYLAEGAFGQFWYGLKGWAAGLAGETGMPRAFQALVEARIEQAQARQ